MKFTIQKEEFTEVLTKVQGLTGRKSGFSITDNVLLTGRDNEILLQATDTETAYEGIFDIEIEEPGVMAVNARKLLEIIKAFPKSEILVHEVEERWFEIRDENVEFHIMGMDSEEFPEIPKAEEVSFYSMNLPDLRNMIEKNMIIPQVPEDSRPHFRGARLELLGRGEESDQPETEKSPEEESAQQEDHEKGLSIRMVSTDNSRLSIVDYPVFGEYPLPESVLIPKKGLNEVAKFLDEGTRVEIGVENNLFFIRKDAESISVRLLENYYPSYAKLLERELDIVFLINRIDFLKMVKRMSIFTDEEYKAVIFNFYDNKMKITATNPRLGDAKEEMEISYPGESVSIAFNPKLFIDGLEEIEDDLVQMKVKDEENPCFIKGENDPAFLYIIMPMRI